MMERCTKEQVQRVVHCRGRGGVHRGGVCEVSPYNSFNCAVCLKIEYNVGEMFVDKPCNTHAHTPLKTHGLGLPWWSRG